VRRARRTHAPTTTFGPRCIAGHARYCRGPGPGPQPPGRLAFPDECQDQLIALYGRSNAIRLDNGRELMSQTLIDWADARGITVLHIQPAKPLQNAFLERVNRDPVLHTYLPTARRRRLRGLAKDRMLTLTQN